MHYLQLSVQSGTHDPRDLLARFELFLEQQVRDLEMSSDAVRSRFDVIRKSLIEEFGKPPQVTSALPSLLTFFF
jgi:insulysin